MLKNRSPSGQLRRMTARKTGPRRHVPQRTCVGCRQVLPKRELIRLVRSPEGVRVDPTSKAHGRGAYLHNLRSCWEAGLKGSLAAALRTVISPDNRLELEAYMNQFADRGDGSS